MKVRLKFFRIGFLAIILSVLATVISAQQASAPADKPVVPNIELATIDGQPWDLHSNRGSVVVLNFWATWCEPCRTETPMLVKIADEYTDRGVKVVGIALDEGGEALVRRFATEYKIDYTILMPPAGSPLYGMKELPTTLLIDSEGRLEEKYIGAVPENVLRGDLDRIAKPAASKGK